jgi:hypothetical protein
MSNNFLDKHINFIFEKKIDNPQISQIIELNKSVTASSSVYIFLQIDTNTNITDTIYLDNDQIEFIGSPDSITTFVYFKSFKDEKFFSSIKVNLKSSSPYIVTLINAKKTSFFKEVYYGSTLNNDIFVNVKNGFNNMAIVAITLKYNNNTSNISKYYTPNPISISNVFNILTNINLVHITNSPYVLRYNIENYNKGLLKENSAIVAIVYTPNDIIDIPVKSKIPNPVILYVYENSIRNLLLYKLTVKSNGNANLYISPSIYKFSLSNTDRIDSTYYIRDTSINQSYPVSFKSNSPTNYIQLDINNKTKLILYESDLKITVSNETPDTINFYLYKGDFINDIGKLVIIKGNTTESFYLNPANYKIHLFKRDSRYSIYDLIDKTSNQNYKIVNNSFFPDENTFAILNIEKDTDFVIKDYLLKITVSNETPDTINFYLFKGDFTKSIGQLFIIKGNTTESFYLNSDEYQIQIFKRDSTYSVYDLLDKTSNQNYKMVRSLFSSKEDTFAFIFLKKDTDFVIKEYK